MLRKNHHVMFNPMRISSAAFLLLSPFLTWITIVSVVVYQGVLVFGAAAQSNLLMVSSSELGTNISTTEATGATFSMVLLILSGLAMVKSAKVGVPIGIFGLTSYLLPFYQLFGSQTAGLEQTFTSPGIGFFVAGTGVVLGTISTLTKPGSAASLFQALKTRRGLSKVGISVSVVGIALDVANHTVLGQLPDFIGSTPLEQLLHLGLVSLVASMFVGLIFRKGSATRYLPYLAATTLFLLGADASFSIATGNLHDFLGHNPTETVLHLAVYYGVALTLISNFIRKD